MLASHSYEELNHAKITKTSLRPLLYGFGRHDFLDTFSPIGAIVVLLLLLFSSICFITNLMIHFRNIVRMPPI